MTQRNRTAQASPHDSAPAARRTSMSVERYWDDAKVGDEAVSPSVTVTEDMIMTYARLTGDFTPVHVDEAYARTTPFGTRVAHGLLGLSLADGLKTQADYRFLPGMSLGWTWDFALPIKIGDTLHVKFKVGSMRPTKRPDWGIVVLPSELVNQRGEVVQKGEHRLMIPRRPDAATA
jgi:acyl dehydratase